MTPDQTQDNGILLPEELQFENDQVDTIGENRYLVRSDGDSLVTDSVAGGTTITTPDPSRTHLESDHAQSASETGLTDADEPHGVDITLKTDGEIAHHHARSHDVREVFIDLLIWYAGQLDDDMSPSEVLQVMLATSDLET